MNDDEMSKTTLLSPKCRHCHETFTSKISFRIHQRKHTEEARKRGTMDGEEPLRPILQEKKSQPRKIATRKRRRPFGRGETATYEI